MSGNTPLKHIRQSSLHALRYLSARLNKRKLRTFLIIIYQKILVQTASLVPAEGKNNYAVAKNGLLKGFPPQKDVDKPTVEHVILQT